MKLATTPAPTSSMTPATTRASRVPSPTEGAAQITVPRTATPSDHVESDPIRALESFALGWFPAEGTEPAEESTAAEPGDLPPSLAAFHRLARLRPALLRFPDPVLKQPERASGPLGDRLVFAVWHSGSMDWSIPWPPEGASEADPRVWHTEDPYLANPETTLEEEPLSRFLLQFTLYGAMNAAPYHARTYCMPTQRLDPLWSMLRPVPLSPFLPAYEAEKFFVAPGLLTAVSSDENEAVVTFAALHRGTLTPLLEHGFRWVASWGVPSISTEGYSEDPPF